MELNPKHHVRKKHQQSINTKHIHVGTPIRKNTIKTQNSEKKKKKQVKRPRYLPIMPVIRQPILSVILKRFVTDVGSISRSCKRHTCIHHHIHKRKKKKSNVCVISFNYMGLRTQTEHGPNGRSRGMSTLYADVM